MIVFGPLDVDERNLGDTVSTMLTFGNRADVELEVAYTLEPAGWTNAAGATSGRERLRPGQDVLLPIRGVWATPLYPVPAVRATWEYDGKTHESTTAVLVRKMTEVRRAVMTVEVDGVLGEECWLFGHRLGHFGTEGGEGPVDPSPQWISAYDDTNLYLGFVCAEPAVDSVVAPEREADDPAIAEDESLEVWLDCAGLRYGYHRLVVNAAGAILDEECSVSPSLEPDRSWQSEATVSVQRGRQRYYVEMAVPLSALSDEVPELGTIWLINVARNQRLQGSEKPTRALWNANPLKLRPEMTFGALVFR